MSFFTCDLMFSCYDLKNVYYAFTFSIGGGCGGGGDDNDGAACVVVAICCCC